MERLDFDTNIPYNAVEAAIHLNRYAIAKQFCSGKRVLDVACGEGYGSYLLKRWGATHVDALDIDEATVEKAKKFFGSENVCFQVHTAEELPFQDGSVDLITSFETIEHLDNPEKFLREIKRILAPGGTIILSCPNDPYYYKEDGVSNPFHKRKYTYFDFKSLTEKYLGDSVHYFLSFAINGFVNMPVQRSTDPADEAAPANMFEMLNYVECSSALWIKQERYINHWNSNYYVGIWGSCPSGFDVSTVVFPRETFLEVKDEDVEFIKEVKEQRAELSICKEQVETLLQEAKVAQCQQAELAACKEQLEALLSDVQEAKDNIRVLQITNDRSSAMLELTTKESELLRTSQWNTQCELDAARKNAESCLSELNIMKSTKGYKLLNCIYRIRCKFRRR